MHPERVDSPVRTVPGSALLSPADPVCVPRAGHDRGRARLDVDGREQLVDGVVPFGEQLEDRMRSGWPRVRKKSALAW